LVVPIRSTGRPQNHLQFGPLFPPRFFLPLLTIQQGPNVSGGPSPPFPRSVLRPDISLILTGLDSALPPFAIVYSSILGRCPSCGVPAAFFRVILSAPSCFVAQGDLTLFFDASPVLSSLPDSAPPTPAKSDQFAPHSGLTLGTSGLFTPVDSCCQVPLHLLCVRVFCALSGSSPLSRPYPWT